MGRRSTGTVRPAGQRIQIGYTEEGERQWFTVDLKPTKTNLDAVKKNIREYIAKHQGAAAGSFSEVAQRYLDQADIQLSTRNSYRDSLNIYWLPDLGTSDLSEISFRRMDSLDKSINWTSAKTRRNAICALRAVFKYGYQLGGMTWKTSPAHTMVLGKRNQEGDPDPYTREERNRIIEAGGTFEALAFGTGARTGELIALTWESFDGHRFRINTSRVRAVDKGTKTGNSRSVILPEWLRDTIRSHPDRFRGAEIIRNQYGRAYTKANHLIDTHRELVESLGIRYRKPYAWRSTYASLALMDGSSPEFVAAQLGHSVDVMRKHYARWISGEYDDQEMAKMKW